MCPCFTLRDTGAAGLTCWAPSAGAASSSAGATTGTARPCVVRAGEPASEEMAVRPAPRGRRGEGPAAGCQGADHCQQGDFAATAQVFTAITGPGISIRHLASISELPWKPRTDSTTIRLQKGRQNGHTKGPRDSFRGPWGGFLVAVVSGLVRACHFDVQILGLLLGQLGQLDVQGREVKACRPSRSGSSAGRRPASRIRAHLRAGRPS